MPTYRSITITVHSQFDIDSFPERPPRPQPYYTERGITSLVPPHIDEKTSTCNVYIPVYPGSQFWLAYSVAPPVPEDQHFLFKLYINGAHVVSWSAGKDQEWKGKTMFALFEAEDEEGKKRFEKRVLCFTAPGEVGGEWGDVMDAFDEKACLELRVHRALGRKRVERKAEKYGMMEHGKCERGISLVRAGRAGSEQPKRFYKYALIDPIDKPFATFRYFYRTWDQFHELGLADDDVVEDGESTGLPIIEPCDTGASEDNEASGSRKTAQQELGDIALSKQSLTHEHASSSPNGIPMSKSYRLSVPPSRKLDPPDPSSRLLPSIPQKNDVDFVPDTSYRPHPAFPVNDWETRTPSPVQSLRETISTPTFQRRRGLTPTGWLNAIAGSWRRRGTPTNLSSDGTPLLSDDASRAASRSDSRGVR